jgi:hypothetical protein
MTVVHVHVDAPSLDDHMDIVGPRLKGFADLLTLSSIRIYGEPSAKAVEQLRQKMSLLGTGDVIVSPSHAGFSRNAASDRATTRVAR